MSDRPAQPPTLRVVKIAQVLHLGTINGGDKRSTECRMKELFDD